MAGPTAAPPCAPRFQLAAKVVENVRLARDTFRLRIEAPPIACHILPGQFVMLRSTAGDDPLLARPFALYDVGRAGAGGPRNIAGAGDPLNTARAEGTFDVVYLVVGKLTARLARLEEGASIDVWGPLGNGFLPRPAEHLVMVAGGIGQTPFVALAAECSGQQSYGSPARSVPRAGKITLCYGARSAEYLAGVADFERLGVEVRLATDDGSQGHHGFVTDLLPPLLNGSGVRVVCCGPEPMMAKVAELTATAGVDCEVSLETPMACGIGICFSCVAPVRQPEGWDYRRTCIDGPVFDARQIVW